MKVLDIINIFFGTIDDIGAVTKSQGAWFKL